MDHLVRLEEQLEEVNRLGASAGDRSHIYLASRNYYMGMRIMALAGNLVTVGELESMEERNNYRHEQHH